METKMIISKCYRKISFLIRYWKLTQKITFIIMVFICSLNISAADFELKALYDPKGWHKSLGASIAAGDEAGILKVKLPGTVIRTIAYPWHIRESFLNKKGLAFKIRGDGKDHYIPVRVFFLDTHFRYYTYVPVKGNDWQEVQIAWDDFLCLNDSSFEIGGGHGIPVSAFCGLGFGDRWQLTYANTPVSPFTFEVKDLRLVENPIPRYRRKKFKTPAVASVIEKMKKRQPVLIYCHGDSITAGTNVKEKRYANLLQNELSKYYGYDAITVKTIAVGGATSYDLQLWAEKDFSGTVKPDLVTICVGANDINQARPTLSFKASVNDLLDRIITYTDGKTSILLIPTLPGQMWHRNLMDDYAKAIREIALDRNLDLYDLAKDVADIPEKDLKSFFCRNDTLHPSLSGHQFISEKLFSFLKK